jgi:mRNA interferase MazF
MTIKFFPRMGSVLVCDFSDLREPEITKVRPVVVVSPRLPHRSELAAVVPLSLTAPRHDLPFCFKLSRNYHPLESPELDCWAKADLVMNVSLRRLNGFKVHRRRWLFPHLDEGDLLGVRHAVAAGLGLDRLKGAMHSAI